MEVLRPTKFKFLRRNFNFVRGRYSLLSQNLEILLSILNFMRNVKNKVYGKYKVVLTFVIK